VQPTPPFRALIHILRSSTGELYSVTTQHVVGEEAAALHLMPSDITVWGAEEGTKTGKKRCKQCLQGVITTNDSDSDNDETTGGPRAVHNVTAAGGGKRQAQPPTDHFERFLDKACQNHRYPIKHKLKDCGMMKNFMVSGSLI
jgi:hypothetical protein